MRFMWEYGDTYRASHIFSRAKSSRASWPPLIWFLSDAIIGTVAEVQVTRQASQALKATWQQRRAFRKGSAALRVLDLLTDYPVLTAGRPGHLLDITPPPPRLPSRSSARSES
ncbi:hypothetical protein LU298_15170 [Komagataeibacter intermedius]|nr:hypothetical protein [Komagataeibacter intermedius]MCF3637827.1 hypothetical protein [Komagataeibacter intermedius]